MFSVVAIMLDSAQSMCMLRQVCTTWCRLAADEFLWRDLVYRHWSIDRSVPRSSLCSTWRAEYERLYDRCPVIESEVLHGHTDQVLHVSFSHDGQLFATTSKDGFIKVNSEHVNSSAHSDNNCIDQQKCPSVVEGQYAHCVQYAV